MSLIDALREFLSRRKCEKTIKYQARVIDFKGLGAEFSGIKFSLGDFKTETKKVEEASELARTLDDYQYNMCALARELKRDDPDWKALFKQRAGAISLISALRGTLVAFQTDPVGLKKNLYDIVKAMQDFMVAFARQALPAPFKALATDLASEQLRAKALSNAFRLGRINEGDVDRLAKEMETFVKNRADEIRKRAREAEKK